MCQETVVDLLRAAPHVPDDARYSAEEMAIYRAGYVAALTVALKALAATGKRFELRERTKRIAARQKDTRPAR